MKELAVDVKLLGEKRKNYGGSRRTTEDKSNYQHFFGMGIVARYPEIDDSTVDQVIEHPILLLQDGFLEAIKSIHPSLRHDLTDAIIKCVIPENDLAEVVNALNVALQCERSVCR